MKAIKREVFNTCAAACLATAAASARAAPTVLWDQSNFGGGIGPAASTTVPLNDFVLAAPTAVSGVRAWRRDSAPGGDGLANGVFTHFSGTLSWYLFADDANNAQKGRARCWPGATRWRHRWWARGRTPSSRGWKTSSR